MLRDLGSMVDAVKLVQCQQAGRLDTPGLYVPVYYFLVYHTPISQAVSLSCIPWRARPVPLEVCKIGSAV